MRGARFFGLGDTSFGVGTGCGTGVGVGVARGMAERWGGRGSDGRGRV